MRFVENGPAIPDQLLIARDEGRVVFFCGAGVSRARAGLPDFFGLAEQVIKRLRVPVESAACKILREAREIESRIGLSGLISADIIFGLLERDFLTKDIDAAVATALRPPDELDLSAHRLLLRLSKAQDGRTKLVTTNFDRLFEDCDNGLRIWEPPRLPDPSRYDELDGIVHLHGIVNEDYSGSHGEGFVLSTSEFGRAYLSDGWATSFFRSVIDRFVVLFIGYQADDPPVRYLLEALNKTIGALDRVYAFQSGLAEDAGAKWRHKGVQAIPYLQSGEHAALWDTLAAWAERADDPNGWYQSRITLARSGPERLKAHERGQIAHMVSTLEGSRVFSASADPPPADWLCVFDPNRRYATPARTRRHSFDEDGPLFDPFVAYGLDDDIVPKPHDPENYLERRKQPPAAWDAFALDRLDRKSLGDMNFAGLRGHWATTAPRLAPRLAHLGVWLGRVAYQPTAVWWAAHQAALHPDIQDQISSFLRQSQSVSTVIRECWDFLFEVWLRGGRNPDHDRIRFSRDVSGWESRHLRRYGAINRPFLTVAPSWRFGRPPSPTEHTERSDLLRLDVKYPDVLLDVPEFFLGPAAAELRKNLELANQLETEVGGFALGNISPIVPDDTLGGASSYDRAHGLSAFVLAFASIFERLLLSDIATARGEFARWPVDNDIFARLRIWAAGFSSLIEARYFPGIILSLSNDAFWDIRHQRDLLLTLAKRWPELDLKARKAIQARLLAGNAEWEREDPEGYRERNAWAILSRFEWLTRNGCDLTFDWSKRKALLQRAAPDWKDQYGSKAAESLESRSGSVSTVTEHSALIDIPLDLVLSSAAELSGKSDDFLVEKDPFKGLSVARPVRALIVLIRSAKRGIYPEWAWRTFLNSDARKEDRARLSVLIARRLFELPDHALASMIRPASEWFLTASSSLAKESQQTFDNLFDKLTLVLASHPPGSGSALIRGNNDPDWTMEALNSPVGKLSQALFHDPRIKGLVAGAGLDSRWRSHCDNLLALGGDLKRHALVIFSHNLNWFYYADKDWTERRILSIVDDGDVDDKGAVWSGFFWAAKVPNAQLYTRLKDRLLEFAKARTVRKRGYDQALAGMLLAGWGSGGRRRYVSNAELHSVLLTSDDEFRSHILWHLQRWSEQKGESRAKWADLVAEFLRDVWPRQRAAKTAVASARLCELLLSNPSKFPEWVDLVLPLLTPVEEHLAIPHLRDDSGIVDRYPERMLALLDAVLPNNVSVWPYRIEAVLHKLEAAAPALQRDERLLELWRKWNSR